MRLLGHLDAPYAPRRLRRLSEVNTSRQIWEQYYEVVDGRIRVLDPKEMPEGARRIESPYEVEARYSTKRSMGWVGYKVHLTESCEEGLPHLITDLHTTAATATDAKQLAPIQDRLAANGVLPAEQLADSFYGYAEATSFRATLVRSTSSALPSRTTPCKRMPTKASTWRTSASAGTGRR